MIFSTYATYISRTVVEYCYFEDTGDGDSESISVKSRENCLRFNTSINNPNAMFSFRNGDNNVAYSNFFLASGGIKCKEANNIYCYNNYFQLAGTNQNTSLPGGGTAPVKLEYFGTGYGSNFNFIHNTFYKCSAVSIASALTNCTWANNIFYSDSGSIFSGSNAGQTFAGNIYQGTLGLTISSGMRNIDPLLVLNASHYYGLSYSSPAIGGASSSYPSIISLSGLNNDPTILFDIEGQARPASATQKDVGCDQYTTGAISNQPLDSCQVGPAFLCPTTTAVKSIAEDKNGFIVYPNPSCGDFMVIVHENETADIIVTDIVGRLIMSFKTEARRTNFKIDTDGVYIVAVKTTRGISTQRIVIKR